LVGAVITGLKEKFDEAVRRNDVKAIVLTGKILSFFDAML
jgi:enoyl-CoA hydratase/carnithine racemase